MKSSFNDAVNHFMRKVERTCQSLAQDWHIHSGDNGYAHAVKKVEKAKAVADEIEKFISDLDQHYKISHLAVNHDSQTNVGYNYHGSFNGLAYSVDKYDRSISTKRIIPINEPSMGVCRNMTVDIQDHQDKTKYHMLISDLGNVWMSIDLMKEVDGNYTGEDYNYVCGGINRIKRALETNVRIAIGTTGPSLLSDLGQTPSV